MRNVFGVCLLCASLSLWIASASGAEFWPLPYVNPPATTTFSYAYSISADGQMISGTCSSAKAHDLGEGVHWRRTGSTWGVMGLGLPSSPLGGSNSPAQAIARDKTVTVGTVSFDPPTAAGIAAQAYCWQANVFKLLPMLPGDILAVAYGSMQVGSTIVGLASSTSTFAPARPVVWLGSFTSGWTAHRLNNSEGSANALDNAGQHLVGWVRPPSAGPALAAGSARKGVVWSKQGTTFHPVWLTSLAGDTDESEALGISTGGEFVVGYSGTLAKKYRPVCWHVAPNGHPINVKDLGMLAGYFIGRATAVSASGKCVVGFCTRDMGNGVFSYDAFVWEPTTGMKSLRNILVKAGVKNVDSWKYLAATSISDDGKTICGYGSDPQGFDHAWAASLP